MKNIAEFFEFCKERERIRVLKEQGVPRPWTTDPVLQNHFFCNIYREYDKTTVWFRENIRNRVAEQPESALLACVAFRWFNKISTGEIIKGVLLAGIWPEEEVVERLVQLRDAKETVFGSGYIISSPYGDPKIEWACACTARTFGERADILKHATSLEAMHTRLKKEVGLGSFMAYEIVTDLRWTSVLCDAPDIMTWANPGPGAARGLGWLIYDYNKVFNCHQDQVELLLHMRDVLARSKAEKFSTPWEMREAEHALCEYDKWRRGQDGMHLKRRYQ